MMTAVTGIEHAYAAADIIAFPSRNEGFGNPPIEAALHMRPVAVGSYPVADELRALGFRWLDAAQPEQVARWFGRPRDEDLLNNAAVARRYLNLADLPARLAELMERVGVPPKTLS
jgi:glycosyltransferase involved in cell wall biosynthesis